jgi:hypothetical protein
MALSSEYGLQAARGMLLASTLIFLHSLLTDYTRKQTGNELAKEAAAPCSRLLFISVCK